MRSMRNSAKYVMGLLALAFVGWLVLDAFNDMRGGGMGSQLNPVVGEVSGRAIHYAEWNAYLENQLAAARQSNRSLTEEEVRVLTDRAWESLVNATLLEGELDRLGIRVTDSEIREAFLNQPPPELFSHPAFQTDGQFDIEKYRRFFTDPSTSEEQLFQMESYYRMLLPRAKLETLVRGGIYVSEAEAWQFYKDTNETASVRFVRVDPLVSVPDSAVTVTDGEIQAYYNSHRDDFSIPATARTNMVSFSIRPTAEDTVAARVRATELAERVRGGEDFAEVATAESGDPNSAPAGGDMGRRARSQVDPTLAEAAFSLPIGQVSDPIETSFGFHVLRVDERWGDSIQMRQIFVPIAASDETEDAVFARMDELEEIALRADLVKAADSLGIPIRNDVTLTQDVDFIPGAGSLGVAPDWAFDPATEIGEVSEFFENSSGYHIFELLDRRAAGMARLADVSPNIRQILTAQKKKEAARGLAQRVLDATSGGASLDEAAGRFGWTVQESGPFRRGDFVPGLGQGTEAIGEAFGTPVGGLSGVVDTGDAVAVLQVVQRDTATREDFDQVKDALMGQLRYERTQEYLQRWLLALRANATVEDHRARLNQNADAL